jgi:4-amino-4-deoxy-L-arabinose transferase-like glycosyltransferase
LIFISSALPFALGRINLTDSLLSFGMALTLLCMRTFLVARRAGRSGARSAAAVGVGLAIGVLSKGLIGLLLPAGILLLWCAVTGEQSRPRELIFSWATPLFLLLAAPWFVLMERAHPGFARYFFIHEHLLRFATASAHRPGPIYYFLPVLLAGLLPWTPWIFPALRVLFTQWPKRFHGHENELFFGLWASVIPVFFSLSHSKLIPYVLPAFPGAAVLVATVVRKKSGRYSALMAGWALVLVVLIVAQPLISRRRSLHDLATKVQSMNADRVVTFRCFLHSLPLVLGHPIVVVDHQNELASDGLRSPDLFWSQATFWEHWHSDAHMVAVLDKGREYDMFRVRSHKTFPLTETSRYLVVGNAAP